MKIFAWLFFFKRIERKLNKLGVQMSNLAEQLAQINIEIRAAIAKERNEVTEKLMELADVIQDLEDRIGADDPALVAAIDDAKKIVGEIDGIFEKPNPVTVDPPAETPN